MVRAKLAATRGAAGIPVRCADATPLVKGLWLQGVDLEQERTCVGTRAIPRCFPRTTLFVCIDSNEAEQGIGLAGSVTP